MNKQSWNAVDYANHSTEQFKWAVELIEKIPLTGNESLLDIGCGDGKITALLSKKCPKGYVVGIDSSQQMIAEATSRFPSHLYPNLSFQTMDGSTLVTHTALHNTFDIIFSNAALHWIKDHKPILKGIYQSLKKGGKCFLSFGGYGNGADLFKSIHTVMDTQKWTKYFETFEEIWAFYHPNDYRQWVLESGLTPHHVSLIPKPAIYSNRDGLMGYLRTAWHQYNRYLPKDHIHLFTSDVVDTYIKQYGYDPQGNISVTMVRLEVDAVKE